MDNNTETGWSPNSKNEYFTFCFVFLIIHKTFIHAEVFKIMTAFQPLVTPEELQCLLGWPQPLAQSEGLGERTEPPVGLSAPMVLRPAQAPIGLSMAG